MIGCVNVNTVITDKFSANKHLNSTCYICRVVIVSVCVCMVIVATANRFFYIFEALLIRLLLGGILQPLCALLAAVVFLPLTAAIILAGLVNTHSYNLFNCSKLFKIIAKIKF